MTKTVIKRNKKEEQKKLAVRIICIALVVALAVTSLLTMFPTLLQQEESYTLQEMIDAGMVYLGEDGNYYLSDEYLITGEDESHEGHDHE